MKYLYCLLFCLTGTFAMAQTNFFAEPYPKEFNVFADLPYTKEDLSALKKIVDSITLQFRQSNNPPTFLACRQANATYTEFRAKGSLDSLLNDMEQEMSWEKIKSRYGKWIAGPTEMALLAEVDGGFYASDNMDFHPLFLNEIQAVKWSGLKKGSRMHYKTEKFVGNNRFNVLKVWQLSDEWNSPVLPATYRQLISYVDYVVDCNTTLKLERDPTLREPNGSKRIQQYVIEKMHRKYIPIDSSYEEFARALPNADLQNYVCAYYHHDDTLRRLADIYILRNTVLSYGEDFNKAMEEIIPKERMLQLKRMARVLGTCGMDRTPSEHIRSIAMLASQTHQWPVFIKAHLSIMDFYMHVVLISNYATAGRNAYLKELEQLNIDAIDLLIGSSLRAANTAEEHYNGEVELHGRALSDTKDPVAFETRIKKMLKDRQLDDLNRLRLFNLYTHYCYYQPTRAATNRKINQLKKEETQYPLLIRQGIKKLKLKNDI